MKTIQEIVEEEMNNLYKEFEEKINTFVQEFRLNIEEQLRR